MTIKNRIRAILTAFLLTTSMAVIAQGPIKPPELEWAPDQILIKLSEEARPGPPVHAGGPPSFSKAFDALAKKSRAGHAKTLFPHYNSAAIESLSKQPAQAQGRGPEMALKKGLGHWMLLEVEPGAASLKEAQLSESLPLGEVIFKDAFESSTNINGKVIDGYLVGATVFSDFNFNGILDAGEPSTITITDGDYSLDFITDEDAQCAGYAPLVVNVPVGAYDVENGYVIEPYQMVYPPKFEPLNLTETFNISPLTSILWNIVGPQIAESTLGGSDCLSFLSDEGLKDRTLTLIEDTISDVTNTYGIDETQLYADYVAEQDQEAQEIASGMVPVLSQSLEETIRLRQEHPNARYVGVTFIQGASVDNDGAYPEAWYRQEYVFDPLITYFSIVKVTDDLQTDFRVIIYGERTQYPHDKGTVAESFEFESRNGDDSPYSCDIKEEFSTTYGGKSYEIVNLSSKSAVIFDDCIISDFDTASTHRYIFAGGTQYVFFRPYEQLEDWHDLNENIDILDISDLANYSDSLATDPNCTGTGSKVCTNPTPP